MSSETYTKKDRGRVLTFEVGTNKLVYGNTRAEKDCEAGKNRHCDGCPWKDQLKCPGGIPEHGKTNPYSGTSHY